MSSSRCRPQLVRVAPSPDHNWCESLPISTAIGVRSSRCQPQFVIAVWSCGLEEALLTPVVVWRRRYSHQLWSGGGTIHTNCGPEDELLTPVAVWRWNYSHQLRSGGRAARTKCSLGEALHRELLTQVVVETGRYSHQLWSRPGATHTNCG